MASKKVEVTSNVVDSNFQVYLDRGKLAGLDGMALLEYADKCEKQEKERVQRLEERERQDEERERERQDKERERERQDKEKERQGQLEHDRFLAEEETKRIIEIRKIETQHSQRLEGDNDEEHQTDRLGRTPRVHTPFPKLAAFKEKSDDIDSYLFRFETHATSLQWPRRHWVTYLSALLEGTALTLYHSLSEAGTLTYEFFKESLLKKFQCTPEGFRKKFREAKPLMNEPFESFAIDLRRLLDRWFTLSGIEKTYEGVIDLLLTEQLLESVTKDLAVFLCEKDEQTFSDMIKSAEAYRRAHPSKVLGRKGEWNLFASVSQYQPDRTEQTGHHGFQQPHGFFRGSGNRGYDRSRFVQRDGYRDYRGRGQQGNVRGFQRDRRSVDTSVVCFLCQKVGHRCSVCPWKKSRDPCKICGVGHPPGDCPYKRKESTASSVHVSQDIDQDVVCSVTDEFSGKLKFELGSVNNISCSVLRDTGATICGVRKRLVRDDQMLEDVVKCISFGGRIEEFQTAAVEVHTPYYTGPLRCCVIEAPVADLIIGNIDQLSELSVSGDSCFSASVITRARSKHVVEQKLLADLTSELNVSPVQLALDQKTDSSLKLCFQLAESGQTRTAGNTSHSFCFKDGLLFRAFKRDSKTWDQLVVPTDLRPTVLAVSHDLILSGHCGARRTLSRLRGKFFWPGVTIDVAKYVASCDICQKTEPKGNVPPVPLASMPLIGAPLDMVAIDLVGPISPPSSKGHRYVLTFIDCATRYPDAVPLKDISAQSVADGLFSIYSRLGLPRKVLSDNGPQFRSDLMYQVQEKLKCKGIHSTPYHPQGNGMVERFHRTLKSMLTRVADKQPELWHEYLPAVLFACRELPSESTGFSPFTLMFGREVRGPIGLLYDQWTGRTNDSTDDKPLCQYVFDLQNMIEDACKIAVKNSFASSEKAKTYFDRKARHRKFQEGDEVLVLLPTHSSKLLSRWQGPFTVVTVKHPNYKIVMKGKEKLLHANLLKKYIRREPVPVSHQQTGSVGRAVPWCDISPLVRTESSTELVQPLNGDVLVDMESDVCCFVGVVTDTSDDLILPTLVVPLSTSVPDEDIDSIKFEGRLTQSMFTQIRSNFLEFQNLLTTKPGDFSGDLVLNIFLTTQMPMHRKMYQLPFSSKQVVEREIQTMLDLGVIEKSVSPYSAPVVLVRKKDNSCRFCVDYRWLNNVTRVDAEPIPDVEALFASLANAKYFTKIDLAKGYWQIRVAPEDRFKTAFATHLGLFQFIRMPFGLVSAPAVFARMMRMLHLETCSAVNFFDDILVHSIDWHSHLVHVRAVLQKLNFYNLTARPSKIEAGFQSLEFLGHVVGLGKIRPTEEKVQKILQLPTPTTKKQVRSLLGLISFYRRYVPNFATLAAPLTALTSDQPKSSRTVFWSPQCADALQRIQTILSSEPVLLLPQLHEQFVVRTDASSVGLGAVLLQDHEGVLHPIIFASRKLLPRECNYSTIEKECLAIVWAIQKFVRFLSGVQFVLQTDHRPLTYLRTSSYKNSRILRWALLLQEFAFEVKPIAGSSNTFADLLSRSSVNQILP